MALVAENRHAYKASRSGSPPCSSCSSPAELVAVQCPDSLNCATTDQLTEQCTDQCVVIACNDPDHTEMICEQAGPNSQCEFVCDEAADCVGCHGFDAFLQCCDDYHAHSSEAMRPAPVVAGAHATAVWETAFAQWCAACAEMDNSHSAGRGVAEKSGESSSSAVLNSGYLNGGTMQPVFENHSFSPRRQPTPTPAPAECTCMWAGCNATFASLSELVGHVNLDHLAPPSSSSSSKKQSVADSANASASMSCLWDNCGSSYYSSSNSFESLANHLLNDHLSVDFSSLPQSQPHQDSQHIEERMYSQRPHHPIDHISYEELQRFHRHQHQQHQPDHQHPHQHHHHHQHQPPPTEHELYLERNPLLQIYTEQLEAVLTNNANSATQNSTAPVPGAPPSPPLSLPSESGHGKEVDEALVPITTPSNHSCGGAHECRWKACGLSFQSCDALTTHINDVHVGGGKAHYECFWDQCPRNGEQGFQSKQKISRHVQSHTGHRPFQCNICQQNFSEAATLQQHIRRHTQEKPYICDHPGCNKCFAITGALTIHKRTHNGDKPFKCTYCDRGFAESSNLSKHLRTHTGARPYTCVEPGCGKAFARPDQLNRHKGVHRKQTRGVSGTSEK